MTPEEQRIAIAQALGAKWRRFDNCTIVRLTFKSQTSQGVPLVECERPSELLISGTVPQYLSDLNAMHEAEKTLVGFQKTDYFDNLVKVSDLRLHEQIFTTASQRAEAFLRTLNLWTP